MRRQARTDSNHHEVAVLAIDPGPTESAYVVYSDGRLHTFGKLPNANLLEIVKGAGGCDVCVIEQVCSYGMAVGAEVFETVFWSGRFWQASGAQTKDRLPRLTVKLHLCHDSRAKDGNIRQALIDRFGAPGTKKTPGMLYGVSGDVWAALAVAVTWVDRNPTACGLLSRGASGIKHSS